MRETFAFTSAEHVAGLVENYPELAWLTGAVDATPEASINAEGKTLSERAFGARHIELDRTLVGILVLKWILNGDYEAFTACQKTGKLSQGSFDELREYAQRILPNDEAVDAMIACMVINDLGKIKAIVARLQADTGVVEVDHDRVLLTALTQNPGISPSFNRLSEHFRSLILRGLEARWNGGQGIQAEDLDASWQGIATLDQDALDFYLLHLVCDVAGAAGQFVQNGSVVMAEDTWTGFKLIIKALDTLKSGGNVIDARSSYLDMRGELLGLDAEDPEGRALTVIGCMLRKFDMESADQICRVFDQLEAGTQAILVREMNQNGIDNLGTLLYYSPALLANAIKTHTDPQKAGGTFEEALTMGLNTMARIYHQVFRACRKREDRGVVTVMVSAVADVAARDPRELAHSEFVLVPRGENFEVAVRRKSRINARAFEQILSLGELPGQRIGVWGIGGGSDCLQAAILADFLAKNGKDLAFVGSVRTKKTGSQGADGKIGEQREVENHGGEIFSDVFLITPETRGSGRFLEFLPADRYPVYLVMDRVDGTVTAQMQAVIDACGGVDTVILVDTGGDALFSVANDETDQTKSTPDQDLRILQAADGLKNVRVISCEFACGVDAPGEDDPKDAQTVMRDAEARFYRVLAGEAEIARGRYAEWRKRRQERAGSSFLGKTPLAFEAALDGMQGYSCLDIDEALVLDRANPWHPFIYVDGGMDAGEVASAMDGLFFMELDAHLKSIGAK